MKRYSLSIRTRLQSVHYLFLAIALPLGIFFALVIPPMWGVDESAHFARAYEISQGGIATPKLRGGNYGDRLPQNLVQLNLRTAAILVRDAAKPVPVLYARKDLTHPERYSRLLSQRLSRKTVVFDFPGAAVYSPVAYAPAVVGIWIGRGLSLNLGQILFLARLGTLLGYIGLVFVSLRLLAATRMKWLVFSVALLPMALFQASFVTADAMTNGLSLLLFAGLLAIWQRSKVSRGLTLTVVATAVALPLVKPNYLIFSLLALALPAKAYWLKLPTAVQRLLVGLVIGVPFALWTAVTSGVDNAVANLQAPLVAANINPGKQLSYIIHHPQLLPRLGLHTFEVWGQFGWVQLTGDLGWNNVNIPMAAVIACLLLLVGAALYGVSEGRRWPMKWWFGLMGIVTAISVFASIYLTFDTIGNDTVVGVQGRYFIPVLPFLLYAIAAAVPIKLEMSERAARWIFGFGGLLVLLLSALYYTSGTY